MKAESSTPPCADFSRLMRTVGLARYILPACYFRSVPSSRSGSWFFWFGRFLCGLVGFSFIFCLFVYVHFLPFLLSVFFSSI
jgi:hypothetical protein